MPSHSSTLSLSTCWLAYRHTDGYGLIQEVKALGFSHVELSHGFKPSLVPGVLRAYDEGLISVTSIHNFCPTPPGPYSLSPNLYKPSSTRISERSAWIRYTKATLDFAARLNVKAVVCHLGSVGFFWSYPLKPLKKYLEASQGTNYLKDPAFIQLRDKALLKIRKRKPGYWENTLLALAEVVPYAKANGVCLCFEVRESLDELPLDEDFISLFNHFSDSEACGYWHDIGHAQIKHLMGVIDHRTHVQGLKSRTVGFHLHDVTANLKDHQEIGTGTGDFSLLKDYAKPSDFLVLELSPSLSQEAVLRSKQFIENILTP